MMAKQGKQEAAYPSLLPMPHCLVAVMFEPSVSLVLPSYIPRFS